MLSWWYFIPISPIADICIFCTPKNTMELWQFSPWLHEKKTTEAVAAHWICFHVPNAGGGHRLIHQMIVFHSVTCEELDSVRSLVGGLEHDFYFSIQLGMSSSQLTKSIIFQRGRSTSNQIKLSIGWRGTWPSNGWVGHCSLTRFPSSVCVFRLVPVFFVHVSSIFWDVSQAKRAVALAGEAIRKNGLPKA